MIDYARCLTGGLFVVMMSIAATSAANAHDEGRAAADGAAVAEIGSGVRTSNPAISAVLREASERSATFRGLVQSIEASDGIVRVEHGICPSRAPGCLLWTVAIVGPHRILQILVDTSAQEDSLMAAIGHEMQHAIEVLSNRMLRTNAAIQLFYRRTGRSWGAVFETDAAVKTGYTVLAEVRR